MSARIEPAKQCDTACVLMLAGGIQRSISSGTRVSVGAICVGNRLGAKTPIEHREGVAARGYEQFELYFAQMGIHRDVIETIYRARSLARQIRIPERDWWRLRLATEAPL